VTYQSLLIFLYAGIFSNELMSLRQGLINNYETMQIISVSYLLEATDHYRNKCANFQDFIMHNKI
jgi:hypothetical protein